MGLWLGRANCQMDWETEYKAAKKLARFGSVFADFVQLNRVFGIITASPAKSIFSKADDENQPFPVIYCGIVDVNRFCDAS